jgi:peptidoglycan/LPS O-acetylase OafA/YrhL
MSAHTLLGPAHSSSPADGTSPATVATPAAPATPVTRAAAEDAGAHRSATPGTQVAPVGSETTARRPGRDGYIDTLRAAALVRVVTYHVFGWIWLPIVFPSMGIMFALAGSLMASSLDRSKHRPWGVLRKRLRRLLPPLWLMGAVLVPLMIWHGWTARADGGSPLNWQTMLLWVLPISDPPGSDWGVDWVVPLWYIRAYLWFVLLSPSFLWLFRRWPKRVLAIPLLVILLVATGGIDLGGRTGDAILSMGTFGACWLLGFAHHDGTLRRLPWRVVLPLGGMLLAAGLGWALTHPDPASSWNVDEIPAALTLYSLGAVLVLLRAQPTTPWTAPGRIFGGLIGAINARAVTIYLWNNVAIFAAVPLIDSWAVTAAWDTDSLVGQILLFAGTWICLIAAIGAFGWVEDWAARRPTRINPWPGTHRVSARSAVSRLLRLLPSLTPAHWQRWAPRHAAVLLIALAAGALPAQAIHPAGSVAAVEAMSGIPSTATSLQATGTRSPSRWHLSSAPVRPGLSGLLAAPCPDTASCTPRPGTVAP